MHVAQIRVHPIKSCRPVRRESSRIVAGGLEHDRRYLVVDRTGTFMTLRTLPELSSIDVVITADEYAVTLPDGSTFNLGHDPSGPRTQVGIWGHPVYGAEQIEAGEALSDWAGVTLRLVGLSGDDSFRRLPDGLGVVSFADQWPLLAVAAASVEDLSRRVGSEMAIDRFRPNLVFDDMEAYAEDGAAELRVGDVTFRGVSLCSRCVATTIDPKSGVMGTEPLTTLAGYRRFDRSVYFGANLVPIGTGTIHEGDPVVMVHTVDRLPL